MTEDAFRYLAHENYLIAKGQDYHYAFRDLECIARGQCEFPEIKRKSTFDTYFVKFLLAFPALGGVVGFAVVGGLYLREWFGRRRTRAKDLLM
jgi:hypothetical protein